MLLCNLTCSTTARNRQREHASQLNPEKAPFEKTLPGYAQVSSFKFTFFFSYSLPAQKRINIWWGSWRDNNKCCSLPSDHAEVGAVWQHSRGCSWLCGRFLPLKPWDNWTDSLLTESFASNIGHTESVRAEIPQSASKCFRFGYLWICFGLSNIAHTFKSENSNWKFS